MILSPDLDTYCPDNPVDGQNLGTERPCAQWRTHSHKHDEPDDGMRGLQMESKNRTTAVLLCVKDLALQLDCSERHIWKMNAAGELPASIRLGRLVKWRAKDIEAWLAAGCPRREVFEKEKKLQCSPKK